MSKQSILDVMGWLITLQAEKQKPKRKRKLSRLITFDRDFHVNLNVTPIKLTLIAKNQGRQKYGKKGYLLALV